MKRKVAIDQWRQDIVNCTRCELSSRKGIIPVPWRGPTPAKIAVIGEAPGAMENHAGKPFVGPSGLLLEHSLRLVRLRPERMCIFNTVQCFPGGSPEQTHTQACRLHVKRMIQLASPRFILLLGRYAAELTQPGVPMSTLRGTYNSVGGRVYYYAWHPAYVLRNRAAEADWLTDLDAFARLTRS